MGNATIKKQPASSKTWRELSGKENWEGLLDPLDADLRRHIINYGEMAQAVYDAFNSEKASIYAGASRYARKNLFDRVGLGQRYAGRFYRVTKFLYATSRVGLPEGFIVKSLSSEAHCRESNWMGFVAVATDEGRDAIGRRDVVVAWRGTRKPVEWVNDLEFVLVSASEIFADVVDDVKVHHGWMSVYTSDDPTSPFNKTSAREQARFFHGPSRARAA